MNLEGFAAAIRGVAGRAETELASTACRAGAREFLTVLREVTPKRSGRLAGSETVTGPAGGGAFAFALVGPHVKYDRFRNDGGTVSKHSPGSLGTPEAGWFGHSVTQAGAHYMEKAAAVAAPAVAQACQVAAAEIIRL